MSLTTFVHNFLQEDGWHPRKDDDDSIFYMGYTGKNGSFSCVAHVREDLDQLLFYVLIQENIPDTAMDRAVEFFTRANYGLRVGNFELDISDGEVRYKSSIDCEGAELTNNWLTSLMYPAIQTMDQYYPGILEIIQTDISAEECIEKIENQ